MSEKTQSDSMTEAYFDRNQAVLLAAALARTLGCNVGIGIDPDEPDWPVVFIELPTGKQASWHLPKSELVGEWPDYDDAWDGHTLEMKRARIAEYVETHHYNPRDVIHSLVRVAGAE